MGICPDCRAVCTGLPPAVLAPGPRVGHTQLAGASEGVTPVLVIEREAGLCVLGVRALLLSWVVRQDVQRSGAGQSGHRREGERPVRGALGHVRSKALIRLCGPRDCESVA